MKEFRNVFVLAVRMSWHGAVGLSLTSRVCPAADSSDTILHTERCAWTTTQLLL